MILLWWWRPVHNVYYLFSAIFIQLCDSDYSGLYLKLILHDISSPDKTIPCCLGTTSCTSLAVNSF